MHGLHRARWETTSMTFTPPAAPDSMTKQFASEDTKMRYAFGFTVIKQECAKCGFARILQVAGGVREEPGRRS